MSETVIERGNLKLVARPVDETLEEQCKRILSYRVDDSDLGCYKTYEEALMNELYDSYYVHKNNLYELNYNDLCSYGDIVEGEIQEDGVINFLVSYYNGGACLYNMLDKIMGKIDKKIEILNKDDKSIISTCLKCGSNDISIEEEIDYDWEENPYTSGYYLQCNSCGNTNDR